MPLQTINASRSPLQPNLAEPDKSVESKQKLLKKVTDRKPTKALLHLHYSVLKAAIDYHNDKAFFVDVRDTNIVRGILHFAEFGTFQQVVDHLDIFLQDIALAIVIGTDKDRADSRANVMYNL